MTRSDRRPLIGRQVAPPQLVLFDPDQRVLAIRDPRDLDHVKRQLEPLADVEPVVAIV
jgi:hypothetical protein